MGASNSGAEIALEASRKHQTILSGRDTGHVPFNIDGFAARGIIRILRLLALHLFTMDTPIGRKMRPYIRAHGGPLVRFKPADVAAAGVERVFQRTVGTRDGMPVLDGGRVVEVSNVVWATGFRKDFGWIHLPIVGDDGYPVQERGVVTGAPGLYFVGLPFLYAFGSVLITGAARDAKYVAERVRELLQASSPLPERSDAPHRSE